MQLFLHMFRHACVVNQDGRNFTLTYTVGSGIWIMNEVLI